MKTQVLFLIIFLSFFAAESHSDVVTGDEIIIRAGETREKAVSIGDNVTVYGTIRRDAVSLGGDVIVENGGKVNRNAVSLGGNITVKNGARVTGNLVTLGGKVNVEDGGLIYGEQISLGFPPLFSGFTGLDCLPNTGFHHNFYKFIKTIVFWPMLGVFGFVGVILGIIFIILKLILSLFFSILITYFFPGNVSNMAAFGKEHFFKSSLLGLLITFLLPFIIIAFIITIIGIPTVPLFIMLVFVTYLYGSVGLSMMAGRFLPGADGRSDMMNVIIGVFLLMLLKIIPGFGLIFKILFFMASLGIVIFTRYGQSRNEMKRV